MVHMAAQNLAILPQKENDSQISTTVDNTINLKPDKKTKYLEKTQRKANNQGWDNKGQQHGKLLKNLIDEDQTAYEAVSLRVKISPIYRNMSRVPARQNDYHQFYIETTKLPIMTDMLQIY